jgi:hypothetical protein
VEKFNLRKLILLEVRKEYKIEVTKRFAVCTDLPQIIWLNEDL